VERVDERGTLRVGLPQMKAQLGECRLCSSQGTSPGSQATSETEQQKQITRSV
jgi:hypothetical protein